MLNLLSTEELLVHSRYLQDLRIFLNSKDYIEVETPLANPTPAMEPFLYPFALSQNEFRMNGQRSESPPVPERDEPFYLITSPEYNLKILLSELKRNIFQLSHAFRAEDRSKLHSEEFLMLELYRVNVDEMELMRECEELIRNISEKEYSRIHLSPSPFVIYSMKELFATHVHSTLERSSLEKALVRWKLVGQNETVETLRYDELFFTLFLNLIEGHLGKENPCFVYGYPAELSANSVVENGIARRFEIYWKGVELGNGYYELTDYESQKKQFETDNLLRQHTGRKRAEFDTQLMDALRTGLPPCSGIAMGADRLLMLIRNETSLKHVTPVYR